MKLIVLLLVVAMTGCATSPHQTVQALDSSSARYGTPECMQARKVALEYDDKVPGRVGVGLGLGILLGPFGIPLAVWADKSQGDKRAAVVAEVQKACA